MVLLYINELGGFSIIDNELIDNSIFKGKYLKVYHQQEAQLNQSD